MRVERTPLRGLLSKAMELVDDDGDGKTAVATPRPVVDAPTTPSPAVATIPTPRPVVFAPTPSPSTATDFHGPTRRRAYDLAHGGRDGPSHRRRCAHDPASGGRDGATCPALRDPDDDDDGGSQLNLCVVVPADPVANDGIDADANRDREDREHVGLGGDDVGIL